MKKIILVLLVLVLVFPLFADERVLHKGGIAFWGSLEMDGFYVFGNRKLDTTYFSGRRIYMEDGERIGHIDFGYYIHSGRLWLKLNSLTNSEGVSRNLFGETDVLSLRHMFHDENEILIIDDVMYLYMSE